MQEYIYNLATDKPLRQNFCCGGRYNRLVVFLIKALLFILALIYGLIVRVLTLFYRIKPYRFGCKVISVGNITLGGTGKTSLVEYICRYLKENGHKVSVLSRGYKGYCNKAIADEPQMLQMNLKDVPVIVDADRIKSGNLAINNLGVDTLVLDDAFQQWKIEKDLDIVTIDATNPFGNRHMIPRGILREPLSSLKRAGMFVLTKTNLNPDVKYTVDCLSKINPAAEIFESMHKPAGFYNIDKPKELLSPECLKGKVVILFSGIGAPDSFEKLIASLGINIGLSLRFPDHYNYSQKDLNDISKKSRDKNIDTIITTQKDAARLRSLQLSAPGLEFMVLRIAITIKDEQRFHSRLLKLYSV